MLLTAVNVVISAKKGKRAGNDPWQGNTLEWFTSSPPPPNNFDVVPRVRSVGADEGHPARGGGGRAAGGDRVPAGGAAQPLVRGSSGIQRLVLATGIATFVLIILGRVVQVSDSGLGWPAGSGFHGWPFCNGDVVPGVDQADRRVHAPRGGDRGRLHDPGALRAGPGAGSGDLLPAASLLLVLVIAQGALGGATVEENLEEVYVATSASRCCSSG